MSSNNSQVVKSGKEQRTSALGRCRQSIREHDHWSLIAFKIDGIYGIESGFSGFCLELPGLKVSPEHTQFLI